MKSLSYYVAGAAGRSVLREKNRVDNHNKRVNKSSNACSNSLNLEEILKNEIHTKKMLEQVVELDKELVFNYNRMSNLEHDLLDNEISFEMDNINDENLISNYNKKEECAIEKYNEIAIKYFSDKKGIDFLDNYKIYYHDNKIIIELFIADLSYIYNVSSYEYDSLEDSIDGVMLSEEEVYSKVFLLLQCVMYGYLNFIISNDKNDFINEIVINIIHNNIYSMSIDILKKDCYDSNLEDYIRKSNNINENIIPYSKIND